MNNNGLVSIITPTYNCSKYIQATIKSVISQSYKDWEMIIYDDCSTDDTKEIVLSNNDSRIKYFCNENNSGAAVTRNNALKEAKGRWIAFLDSDDLWYPDKLEKQITFMEDNGYSFSCTSTVDFYEDGSLSNKKKLRPKHVGAFAMKMYCWIGCLGTMYDASVVGLVQIEDVKKNNDYAIWLKAIKKADCYSFNEVLSLYRVRESSISHVGSKSKLIKHHYILWRKGEKKGVALSCILTVCNLFFGFLKKRLLMKEVTNDERIRAVKVLNSLQS